MGFVFSGLGWEGFRVLGGLGSSIRDFRVLGVCVPGSRGLGLGGPGLGLGVAALGL